MDIQRQSWRRKKNGRDVEKKKRENRRVIYKKTRKEKQTERGKGRGQEGKRELENIKSLRRRERGERTEE